MQRRPQLAPTIHTPFCLSDNKRGIAWYEATTGEAQIILGTRLAALTPLPNLHAIVVDEEHDPSYKQQEGARYSARDLAIYRAQRCGAKVVLGSATPSLESWHHSRPATAVNRNSDSAETISRTER